MGLSASGARGGAGDLAGRAVGAGPGDVGVGAGGQVVARGGVPLDRLVGGEGDLVEAGAAPGAAVVPGGRRGGDVLLDAVTALRVGHGASGPTTPSVLACPPSSPRNGAPRRPRDDGVPLRVSAEVHPGVSAEVHALEGGLEDVHERVVGGLDDRPLTGQAGRPPAGGGGGGG